MFCSNCGKKLPDDAKFCDACGVKLKADAAAEKQVGQNGVEERNYTTRAPFSPYSTIDPNQPAYQKTVFNGKEATVGTSGQIKFGGEKKKHGCVTALIVAAVVVVALFLLLMLLPDTGITDIRTAGGINSNTFAPVNTTSVFNKDIPVIYVTFTLSGLPVGTAVSCNWYYTDHDYLISSDSIETTMDHQNGYFCLSIPDNGWPSGDYEVRFYADNEYVKSATFTVSE